VVNPWADQLTFTAERTRTRRDHEKYLTLIDAIALLHQHQRPREQDPGGGLSSEALAKEGAFIRVALDDIALANRIAPELLGRSLDELPPQTRRVYEAVKALVRERMEAQEIEQRHALLSRREVRDRLGWGITQTRTHLERLRDMEFIAARYGRPGSSFQYELLSDCREPAATDHIGLLDVEKLRACRGEAPEERRRIRQESSVAEAMEDEPVGENGNPSAGCRPPARQVQPVEEPRLEANLSACSERESGTPLAAVVSPAAP
jgi:DNA primase